MNTRKLKLNIAAFIVLLLGISSSVATNITGYIDTTNHTIQFSGPAFLIGNSGQDTFLGVEFSGPTTPEMSNFLVNLRGCFYYESGTDPLNIYWVSGLGVIDFDFLFLPRYTDVFAYPTGAAYDYSFDFDPDELAAFEAQVMAGDLVYSTAHQSTVPLNTITFTVTRPMSVPDGGSTLSLALMAMAGLFCLRRRPKGVLRSAR